LWDGELSNKSSLFETQYQGNGIHPVDKFCRWCPIVITVDKATHSTLQEGRRKRGVTVK
jgi:hypothetical protein